MSLESADRYAIQRLKYLRQRSMRSPAWREADYLRLYVTPSYMRWAAATPLEPFRLQVLRSLAAFRRVKKGDDADGAWLRVVNDVDRLIAEAERLQGHKIRAQ